MTRKHAEELTFSDLGRTADHFRDGSDNRWHGELTAIAFTPTSVYVTIGGQQFMYHPHDEIEIA